MPDTRPALSTSIDFASGQTPERLVLGGAELVTHYLLPILAGVALAVILALGALGTIPFSLPVIAGLALLAIVAHHFRSRLLRFRRLDSDRSVAESISLLREAAESVRWSVLEDREDLLVFGTIPLQEAPWNEGERITVIFRDGAVWINAINDPANRLALYSGSEISGNIEWIAGVLRDGLFRFESEERGAEATGEGATSEKTSTPFVLPRPERQVEPEIDHLLDQVVDDGTELRFPTKMTGGERTGLAMTGVILFLQLAATVSDYSWQIGGGEVETYVSIGVGILLVIIALYLVHHAERVRFYTIRIDRPETVTYASLHRALEESGWHIGGVDTRRGIVARAPYALQSKSTAVLFAIREDRLNVKLFSAPEIDDYRPKTISGPLLLLFDWLYRWMSAEESAPPRFRPEAGSRWWSFLFKLRMQRRFVRSTGSLDQLREVLNQVRFDPTEYPEVEEEQRSWDIKRLIGSSDTPVVQLYGARWWRITFLHVVPILSLSFLSLIAYRYVTFSGGLSLNEFEEDMAPNVPLIVWVLIAAAVVYWVLQYRRRRCKRIETDRTAEQNYEILREAVVKEWDWKVLREVPGFFFELAGFGEKARCEMITIVIDRGDVIVNSMRHPDSIYEVLHLTDEPSFHLSRVTVYSRSRNEWNVERIERALSAEDVDVNPPPPPDQPVTHVS